MTVLEIVTQQLRRAGFDGLFNDDANCACQVDDLSPCGEMMGDCKAGFVGPCNGTCEDGKCDFHIYATRELAATAAREAREAGKG